MNAAVVHIHPTRRCSNCTHVDPSNEHQCLQLVSLVDGSALPDWFACDEHQTKAEYLIELHRPARPLLGLA